MFLIKMCLTKKVYSRRGQTSTSTNDPQEYQIHQDAQQLPKTLSLIKIHLHMHVYIANEINRIDVRQIKKNKMTTNNIGFC